MTKKSNCSPEARFSKKTQGVRLSNSRLAKVEKSLSVQKPAGKNTRAAAPQIACARRAQADEDGKATQQEPDKELLPDHSRDGEQNRLSTKEMSSHLDVNPPKLVKEVVIDALAAVRIVKHCHSHLPAMVAGSLMGLDVDGVLEITYSYAFPQPKSDGDGNADGEDVDGAEYQIEMMKMLRDVNIDNNCVGWYQSMHMGTIYTNDVVTYQYSYQSSEELSENSVVIMYDPVLSKRGNLVLKAYRLTEKFLQMKRSRANKFIKPADILEELPLTIRSQGHVSAYLASLADSHAEELNCDFEPLAMTSVDAQLEKHIDLMTVWMDDLLSEQQKLQQYARSNSKLRQEQIRWLTKRRQENEDARNNGDYENSLRLADSGLKMMPELSRSEHILMTAQVNKYAQQADSLVHDTLEKINLVTQLNPATL